MSIAEPVESNISRSRRNARDGVPYGMSRVVTRFRREWPPCHSVLLFFRVDKPAQPGAGLI